ncbi:hypothetical protein HELRODRAFT_183684 [Helobdella robusta]|uniref:THAP-type domain-containing protein n=1 Tax=Helobdella robusta TaxID=6412 RepID=T1FK11_HELRO|nr:hypothetical protein HELRODRAFT_183684 [Helobdella robusta]ESO10359.1 hypothetical protein HELRODRAFT_183684 [Helobdella robusta]
MVNKCCVYGCKSGYTVCSKHFTPNDFITSSQDSKVARQRRNNKDTFLISLKPDSVPTIFSNHSKHMLCEKTTSRSGNALRSSRNNKEMERLGELERNFMEEDSIIGFKAISECDRPISWDIILTNIAARFKAISECDRPISWDIILTNGISKIEKCLDLIDESSLDNDEIIKMISFLKEELQLVLIKKHKRYSYLMKQAFILMSTSTAGYQYLYSSKLLCLLSSKTMIFYYTNFSLFQTSNNCLVIL